MRIVHVFHHYWPVMGGLENAVKNLAEEQARLGHEVHVVTSTYNAGSRHREEYINGVYVHRVKSFRLFGYPDLTYPLEYPGILEGADIIHGYSQNSLFVSMLSLYAKKEFRKPLIYYFVGVDYLKRHYNPLLKLLGFRYQRFLTKKLVRYVDIALVTNDFEKKILRDVYGLEAYVLPHGVNEIYFNTPNKAEEFRRKYDIDGRIVGYIGRIHSTKGLDLLIRALAEVVKEEKNLMLVIAGKGDEKYLTKCMKLAKRLGIRDRVRYLGYVPEEDKIGLIDASEVIVLPSRHAGESYPLLIDEVKAREKPLVATNYGSLPYMIVDGVEGVVAKAEPHSLADAILHVLREKERFRIIRKPITWREVALGLEEIYQKNAELK